MKTLIVYYSYTHNNELLANALRQELQCDILKIEEVKPRRGYDILFDLVFNRKPAIKLYPAAISSYDRCIFVAPVWAGKIASPLRTFLLQEKYHINRYAFITVCNGAPGQKKKLFRSLTKLLDQEPSALCELVLDDLSTAHYKVTNDYRLQEQDINVFASKIDEFLKKTEWTPSIYEETEKII